MSNLFDLLEKYKFGLLAALLSYVAFFAYFQIGTYNGGGSPYSPFHEGARIEIPEDEIKLLPENIMLPANFQPGDVKNTVRDANDERKRSEKNYDTHSSTSSGAMSATEFEKTLFENAEGVEERKKIEKMIQTRKEREREAAKVQTGGPDKATTSGANNAAAGNVMVEFSLTSRTKQRLPIPSYMCGVGSSGRVVMVIRVDNAGNVVSATHDTSKNQGNVNGCMVEQAKKYALQSRFNYSDTAGKSQEGWISYTFVSQ